LLNPILPSPNGIQTILFDLDGTLRYSRPDATHTFLAKAMDLGLSDTPESRRRGMRWNFTYWADSDELKADLQAFSEDETGFWLNFALKQLAAFDCPSELAREIAPRVHAFMAAEFDPEDIVPREVPETLALLKDAGFKLAVVSNRDSPYSEYLEEIGLGQFFDFSLAAGVVNSWNRIRRSSARP
jgi:FMN phosphatase YigB (HAD superfamily)